MHNSLLNMQKKNIKQITSTDPVAFIDIVPCSQTTRKAKSYLDKIYEYLSVGVLFTV